MKRKIEIIAVIALFSMVTGVYGQNKDKAIYREAKPGFFQNVILKEDQVISEKQNPDKPRMAFTVDMSNASLPNKMDMYKNVMWHNPTISQGNTNTCWCFSTTSFLESEAYRINKIQVKLSEAYTVYWEYVEKTKGFIESRGTSNFDEGSEANAVPREWKKYGIVPEDAYLGRSADRKYPNDALMVAELKAYLASVKAQNAWDEDAAVATVKAIIIIIWVFLPQR